MSSEASFKANPAERPVEARAPSSLAGSAFYLALIGAGVIHAFVLAILIFDANRAVTLDPQTQEIPVEIVVEPPPEEKPEPPPPKSESSPAPQPPDEAPAFDAPRTANTEKANREAPDQTSKAPDAPTPTPEPSAGGAAMPADAAPTHAGEAQAAANAAEPTPDKPDAEVIKQSEPDPANSEQQEAHADAKAEPQKMPSLVGEPFPAWSGGPRLPSFEPLPDIKLSSAAEATPIGGGNAKATYLTILSGLVMAHMHMPASIDAQSPRIEGQISFEVDGGGRLIQRHVTRSSGSRELDSAALAAVNQAAPFPAPPQGAPLGLKFTYGAR
jgi:TonB family protein